MNDIDHSTFTIERDLPGSPRHAFRFWSELELKLRWTDCHPDWTVLEEKFDFRIGGDEVRRWRMPDGQELAFRARYFDIEPARRIIYAFDMSFGGARQSVSLATVELLPAAAATRMVFTEQLAFLGDAEARRRRVEGTAEGFDRLVATLESERAGVH
jgi:uncharacterized protein YndB with AHSA1/START domain